MTIKAPEVSHADFEKPQVLGEAVLNKARNVVKFRVKGKEDLIFSQEVLDASVEVPPNVPLQWKVAEKNGRVEMVDPQLQLLASWSEYKQKLDPALQEKHRKLSTILGSVGPGTLALDVSMRPLLEDALLTEILNAGTPEEKRFFSHAFLLQKHSYRGDQQIPMGLFNQSVMAIRTACSVSFDEREGSKGSGVLVGKGLVLTARHVLEDFNGNASNTVIAFGDGVNDPVRRFRVEQIVYRSSRLDYCLLKLGKALDEGLAGLPRPAALLDGSELALYDGVYAAGYPEGRALAVATNSLVAYPFWIRDEEVKRRLIERSIMQMFDNVDELLQFRSIEEPRVKKFFDESYQKGKSGGLQFYPTLMGTAVPRPAMGTNTDTKSGDSGSPIFDLQSNLVAGILSGISQSTNGGVLPNGETHHHFEVVLPISAIIAELDDSNTGLSGWRQDYAVELLSRTQGK